MLQWFLRFSEFAELPEFIENVAPFRKNSIGIANISLLYILHFFPLFVMHNVSKCKLRNQWVLEDISKLEISLMLFLSKAQASWNKIGNIGFLYCGEFMKNSNSETVSSVNEVLERQIFSHFFDI